MFYAPLEVFSYHFVALPWLSLWLMRYLKTGKKRDLWLLGLGSVFVLPQAFVPTLWLVYLGSVGLILAFNRKVSRLWYKLRLVLGLVILVNAVWLLPYMYGLVKTANRVTSSKINQVSNENILLRNKAFGDFKSVSLIKGFSFDYTDWQSEGESDYMMLRWREWFLKREVEVIGWLFFGLSIWGLGVMLQEKRKTVYPFGGWFLIGFLMLGNQVPGVKWVFQTLTLVPFFKEAFRFVFTKFSLVYVFSMSLLIAVGLDWWLKRLKSKRVMVSLLSLGLGLSLVYYAMPAFKGEFFYENLQVDIPQEYFELIEFFKNENHNSRLVVLPQPDFWGWTYYDWGFRGSGFIWQGLPQASLDGAFLPWSRENENYYWEMNQSILSQDREAFELVMNKYDIGFVVIDKNIKGSGGYKALNIPETEEILSDFRMFELVKDFGELEVYKVKLENPVKDFVKVKTDLVTVGPELIGMMEMWLLKSMGIMW